VEIKKSSIHIDKNKTQNKKLKKLIGLLIFIGIVFFVSYGLFVYFKNIKQSESVRFGFITDAHCYSKFNKDLNDWEINWRCSRPLETFVSQMNNKFNPDFVIEGGDLVDGRDKLKEDGFLEAKNIYDKVEVLKFHVLGNHETNNLTKERWMEITENKRTYYYFDLKGYRFIVLDGNNTYDDVNNPREIVDMEPEMEPHSYKGLMDNEQMKWLEETLNESENLKKIVFIHEPPLDETIGELRDDIFINPKPLRNLFSKYEVQAVFSGHIEELCDIEVDGVRYFTLQGFHKKSPRLNKEDQYKDNGNFYQVTINKDNEIKIEMFFSDGREADYQSIEINQETVVCNNNSLPIQD
jgi:predicted MPP superfamily phosphohydrolase